MGPIGRIKTSVVQWNCFDPISAKTWPSSCGNNFKRRSRVAKPVERCFLSTMAEGPNPEHLKILRQGVEAWNQWRTKNPEIEPYLRDASLHGADLSRAYFTGADLSGADLSGADLVDADLSRADLGRTNLGGADFRGASLRSADLREANLRYANLGGADFRGASLRSADLRTQTSARQTSATQ